MSTMDGSQPRRRAVAGQGGGDVAYRMQSLTYTPVEVSLDESVSLMTLVRLFLWAAIASFAVFMVFLVLFFLGLILSGGTLLAAGIAGSGMLLIGDVVAFIAFWVVLFGSRLDEPIAEWKTLLEDRWEAADSAYAAIFDSLMVRGMPLLADAVRIRSDVMSPETVNNRLLITERGHHSYNVYVSVFPYGSSLYVGWTMWRSRRGATLIGHYLKDVVGGLFGRTGLINQMFRTERVRAMREAVHAAVREGVEVAMRGIEVPIADAFGRDVPVQDPRAGAGAHTR